ncbi:hypothetical protein DN398_25255 [Bacillus sp. JAS102]|nr:hypothetical protein DN398_25255 [Bacillus sp. JAS102]
MDSSFREEVGVLVDNEVSKGAETHVIEQGIRVGVIVSVEMEGLSELERRNRGFGSTGTK